MLKISPRHGFCLDSLINQGFAKSNTMLQGLDRQEFARKIISETEGKTYTEMVPSHRRLIEELDLIGLGESLFRLARDHFGYAGDISNQYHIARHVVPGHASEKFKTHYDSHLFTVVIPLQIPDNLDVEPHCGQLYFAPLHRPLPRNEVSNLLGKIRTKRFAGVDGYLRGTRTEKFRTEDFTDGEALLFLGKQTLHGNLNVGRFANRSRLTILAHYFDDAGFGAGAMMRVLRRR